MANRKLTFNQILNQAGQSNSERLMTKARLANRLAKRSIGRNRQNAYSVKARALCSLVKRLPNSVRVSADRKLTDFVVVELRRDCSGLHLPISVLQGSN